MTSEHKQTLNVLDALARTMDSEQIERRLLDAGYFKASEDERTKKASLIDISNAEIGETKWCENDTFAYKFSLHGEIETHKGIEYAWLHVLKAGKNNVGVPYIERIYARIAR